MEVATRSAGGGRGKDFLSLAALLELASHIASSQAQESCRADSTFSFLSCWRLGCPSTSSLQNSHSHGTLGSTGDSPGALRFFFLPPSPSPAISSHKMPQLPSPHAHIPHAHQWHPFKFPKEPECGRPGFSSECSDTQRPARKSEELGTGEGGVEGWRAGCPAFFLSLQSPLFFPPTALSYAERGFDPLAWMSSLHSHPLANSHPWPPLVIVHTQEDRAGRKGLHMSQKEACGYLGREFQCPKYLEGDL